jgi:chromosome segregation ATPase
MLKMVCLQLRLSKVSELIHNSSQHKNLQQAQVSVFFEEIIDKVRANLQPNCHEAHAV